MSYCFIDYPNFLIANSPYLSPWENPSCFSNSTSKQAKLPDFRTPSYFQLSCVMLTAWGCVVDVVLSQIKDRWQKFQSVLTYEKIIEKFFFKLFSFTSVSRSALLSSPSHYKTATCKTFGPKRNCRLDYYYFLDYFVGSK